jgi:hypothetical protein
MRVLRFLRVNDQLLILAYNLAAVEIDDRRVSQTRTALRVIWREQSPSNEKGDIEFETNDASHLHLYYDSMYSQYIVIPDIKRRTVSQRFNENYEVHRT